MKIFLQETSFHGVMLDKVFNASPERKKILQNIMMEGILSGVVRPLNRTVFPSMEVEQAFRCACHD
jgi:fatty acid synthase